MTKDEFKICFDQYFDPIRNYIYYRCGDTELATDIVQDSFMKVWEKNIFYHPNKTKALLYKIAKEQWITYHRKQASANKYKMTLDFKQDNNSPEQLLEYKELKNKYEETLSNLPDKQRVVFLMSRLEDFTYKEIAVRLDISIKTVEKRMSYALQKLRNIMVYEKK